MAAMFKPLHLVLWIALNAVAHRALGQSSPMAQASTATPYPVAPAASPPLPVRSAPRPRSSVQAHDQARLNLIAERERRRAAKLAEQRARIGVVLQEKQRRIAARDAERAARLAYKQQHLAERARAR
jgi:hypothetical protein